MYGNEKLIPIVIALGCGIGDDFDLSKLRYGKVIIMACLLYTSPHPFRHA